MKCRFSGDEIIKRICYIAFGCGVFNNPPQLVAEVFRKVLIDRQYAAYLEKAAFAIKKTGDTCPNYEAFQIVFKE